MGAIFNMNRRQTDINCINFFFNDKTNYRKHNIHGVRKYNNLESRK